MQNVFIPLAQQQNTLEGSSAFGIKHTGSPYVNKIKQKCICDGEISPSLDVCNFASAATGEISPAISILCEALFTVTRQICSGKFFVNISFVRHYLHLLATAWRNPSETRNLTAKQDGSLQLVLFWKPALACRYSRALTLFVSTDRLTNQTRAWKPGKKENKTKQKPPLSLIKNKLTKAHKY